MFRSPELPVTRELMSRYRHGVEVKEQGDWIDTEPARAIGALIESLEPQEARYVIADLLYALYERDRHITSWVIDGMDWT